MHSDTQQEDIQSNRFFSSLKRLYDPIYQEAVINQLTICVPHTNSLGAMVLNDNFIKTHILEPSKYFKSEYNTMLGQSVELNNGKLQTKTGFNEPRTVNILFEVRIYFFLL